MQVTTAELTDELTGHLQDLICLLQATVEDGASIGFLPPLSDAEARAYWSDVAAAMRGGSRTLTVALLDGRVVGAVQLGLEVRANGRHRAEVMKLMVHPDARGNGIGRELMLRAESLARGLGRTLLVLDTRCGDAAEQLYLRLGYTAAGIVPSYARSASGELHDTVFMFKQLS
jgi:acetyltransferase